MCFALQKNLVNHVNHVKIKLRILDLIRNSQFLTVNSPLVLAHSISCRYNISDKVEVYYYDYSNRIYQCF